MYTYDERVQGLRVAIMLHVNAINNALIEDYRPQVLDFSVLGRLSERQLRKLERSLSKIRSTVEKPKVS